MWNDPNLPKDPNEYDGHRLIGPTVQTGNISMKEIMTDTSGSWKPIARYGSITRWQKSNQQ